MKLDLEGKGIIVTGGSRGIGRAIAHAFADEGSHVAICARGAEDLRATERELRERGVKVHAQTCDVSNIEELNAFLEAARSALGRVDVLVNNASGFGATDDEAGWHVGFQVDVMAAVRATWTVVPWLEEVGGGSIIHISSTSGLEAGCADQPLQDAGDRSRPSKYPRELRGARLHRVPRRALGHHEGDRYRALRGDPSLDSLRPARDRGGGGERGGLPNLGGRELDHRRNAPRGRRSAQGEPVGA
jgi:hypothetical protein